MNDFQSWAIRLWQEQGSNPRPQAQNHADLPLRQRSIKTQSLQYIFTITVDVKESWNFFENNFMNTDEVWNYLKHGFHLALTRRYSFDVER